MKKKFLTLGVALLVLCTVCTFYNISYNSKKVEDNTFESKTTDYIPSEGNKVVDGISISSQVDLFRKDCDSKYETKLYESAGNDISIYITYVDNTLDVNKVSEEVIKYEIDGESYKEGTYLVSCFKQGDKNVIVTILGKKGQNKNCSYIYGSLKIAKVEI